MQKYTTTPEIRALREKADAAVDAFIRATDAARREQGLYEPDDVDPLTEGHMMVSAVYVAAYQDMNDPEMDQIIVTERGTNTTTIAARGMLTIADEVL